MNSLKFNPNMSLGRITGFGFVLALSAICLLPAASCCGSALDVARYAFEPPRSNLLAGSRHIAKSSNDIFGFKNVYQSLWQDAWRVAVRFGSRNDP